MLVGLNACTRNDDHGLLAKKRRRAGASPWLIREKHLALITDLPVGEEAVEKINDRRDALLEALYGIYLGAPSPTRQAYGKAQAALGQYAETFISETEIDPLLPSGLGKGAYPERGSD